MPATIITGFLYLGSYDTASRQDLLKAMGITHILNVSSWGWFACLTCDVWNLLPPGSDLGSAGAVAARAAAERLATVWADACPRTCVVSCVPCCAAVQTVPSCQALYKNTFVYHTLEHSPPDFQECFKFLGEAGGWCGDRFGAHAHARAGQSTAAGCARHHPLPAASVLHARAQTWSTSRRARCWCTA
jgi:hypothetical protein